MANELYRTYEVLVEESVHPDHPKRAKDKTSKPSQFKPEIDGALRDTHMIFQDAVCYNTLLLAGLAGNTELPDSEGEPQPLNPLWKHLTTSASKGGINEETERVIRRLATHYKPLAGITTAEDFLNRIYSEPLKIKPGMSEVERKAVMAMRAVCYRMLEMAGAPRKENGTQECADMAAFGRTWVSLVCAPDSDAEIPGNGGYDRVSRVLQHWLKRQPDAAEKTIKKILNAGAGVAMEWSRAESARAYREKLSNLCSEIQQAERLPDNSPLKAKAMSNAKKARKELSTLETNEMQFVAERIAYRKTKLIEAAGSAMKQILEGLKPGNFSKKAHADIEFIKKSSAEVIDAIRSSNPAELVQGAELVRLSYKGGNPNAFEKALLRYLVLRGHPNASVQAVALPAFREFIDKDKPESSPEIDGRYYSKMPFKIGAKIAFPFFGKLCLEIETSAATVDFEFDKTAFATAAEDVFKYKIRTDVRKAKAAKLLNVVQAYENKGTSLTAEESPTGKPLTIRGMDGDPRWKENKENCKGIVQLLAGMSREKEIVGYGLRAGTIGGWAEVRKMFLRRHKQCAGREKRIGFGRMARRSSRIRKEHI